jgi:NAD(P)-dependent dehydrogenase (short-subunit alcohol dehydrogenase family)
VSPAAGRARSAAGARWHAAVLTGATSGIGEATARRLAERADHVVLLGPEPREAVEPVLDGVRAAGPARVDYVSADFTHLDQVVDAAARVGGLAPEIDLLVNDAGVPGAPERLLTADGFERTLQVNALAPALLTRLLVPSLAPGGRVVNVASSAHRVAGLRLDDPDLSEDYDAVTTYARAKLAMVTWSALLALELRGTGIDVVALCPGLNDTALSAAMTGGIGGPPTHGAARVLHAAVADVPSGSYLEADRVVAPAADALDPAQRARLAALYWERLAPFAAEGRPRGAHRA